MISKNQIKYIRSLKRKKFRQKYDKFIVEGYKTSLEFVKNGKYNIDKIYTTDQNILKEFQSFSSQVEMVSTREMKQISSFKTLSNVLLIIDNHIDINYKRLEECNRILFLDRIQDPGNLGTIIRSVDWFGIDAIVASPGTADFYNPKTISASMGSICGVSLFNCDFSILKDNCPRHTIVGTDMEGKNVYDYEFPDKTIVVIGNEGQGIVKEIMDNLDVKIRIPGVEDKVAESLNAAIAASIICAQWSKG